MYLPARQVSGIPGEPGQVQAAGSRLNRNDGDRFVDTIAALSAQPDGAAVGGVFGDYDNDGDLDLFVSNQASANTFWRNDGSAGFQRVAAELGSQSVGAAFVEHDNDGDLDLATTSSWSQTTIAYQLSQAGPVQLSCTMPPASWCADW